MSRGPTSERVPEEQPCLFCLRAGQEPSIEHVFPGGLGRHADLVLPLGAVCEPCNNRLGRQVDEALVHLMEVQLIRGLHGVPDQRGRVLERIPLSNGSIEFSPEGELQLVVHRDGDVRQADDETLRVKVLSRRRRSGDQWRRATRAVLKIGLNVAYHANGPSFALHRDWDEAREVVLGKPYHGYLLIAPFDVFKQPDMQADLLFDVPGTTAVTRLQYGGLELLADLHTGRAGKEVREWADEREMQVMDIAPRAV